MKKLIIFDFDGTLTDTMDTFKLIWRIMEADDKLEKKIDNLITTLLLISPNGRRSATHKEKAMRWNSLLTKLLADENSSVAFASFCRYPIAIQIYLMAVIGLKPEQVEQIKYVDIKKLQQEGKKYRYVDEDNNLNLTLSAEQTALIDKTESSSGKNLH